LRDECLNLHWFETTAEARQLIETWWVDYNGSRPHLARGNIPPAEYALQAANRCDLMTLMTVQD
jgi:putative transposase